MSAKDTILKNTQVQPEEGWPGDPPGDTRGPHRAGGLEASRFCSSGDEVLDAYPVPYGQAASGLGSGVSWAGL